MKVSVITINYNNKEGLEKTIKSVLEQTFNDFEFIIIDGGSSDGSVDIIKKYIRHIDYWVSEKDKGIYNAMNKGIKVSNGEYCIFMNSSDTFYCPTTLQEFYSQNPSEDIVYGNFVSQNKIINQVEKITLHNLLTHTIGHQSTFIKRYLLEKNPYDENLKIVADWKFFFQELVLNNASYKKINTIIADFDVSGISMRNQLLLKEERDSELKKMLPPIMYNEIYKFFGINDKYYELFTNIGESPNKWKFYNTIIILLKIIKLNKGWIKNVHLKK